MPWRKQVIKLIWHLHLGGKPEIDQLSIGSEYNPKGTYKTLYESGRADETQKLSEVNPNEYDVVLTVGGHGAMYDLAKNEDLHRIINTIYDRGGIRYAVWADDQIVTSRDPFSSELMGEELVKALSKKEVKA
jgi:putative intracellular protease/amidase